MGDTEAEDTRDVPECTENVSLDIAKSSVNELTRSKSTANLAISETKNEVGSSAIANPEPKTPETDTTTLQTAATTHAEEPTELSAKHITEKNIVRIENLKGTKQNSNKTHEKLSARHKSDIFCLQEANLPATIFSVGGAPSKTIHKAVNADKTLSNDTLKRISGKQNQFRNPVTGIGVSSNDEYKNKPSKRRDGNPLLGVGYKEDDLASTHSTQKIPPGGHSKGLW